MNQYELAILRILLKSAAPLSKSKVVNGFPDYSLDFVLSAISDLKQANFIASRDEGSANETLELVRARKKDVLALIISPHQESSQDDAATKQPDRSKSSGSKSAMWITMTLMILGSLTSVYLAYAIGVNDRILASSQEQPQLVSYQDMRFNVAQMPVGNASSIMAQPMPHLQPLEQYHADTIEIQPHGDASITYYYLAPAKVLHYVDEQVDESSRAGAFALSPK